MHIGLIGGIGPAATIFYYERITRAFDLAQRRLELTIVHTSAKDLSANVRAGRIDEQVKEYLRVTRQLAAAGADAVAITSMGGHFCAREFALHTPLPILDGPTAVATKLKSMGIGRVGILGTRVVMQTALYGSLLELDPVTPEGDLLEQVNDDYVSMAIAGKPDEGQKKRLLEAADRLVRIDGARALLLGGTDLNLVFKDDLQLGYPVIDSAALHADSIAETMMQRA